MYSLYFMYNIFFCVKTINMIHILVVTTCLVVRSSRVNFWKSLSGSTDPTADHHGHDGPSRVSRSKTIKILKFGYWDRLSELHDGMAGRTVFCMTDYHKSFHRINSLIFVTEWQDGPSQSWRTVTGCVTLTGSDFYLKVLRGVLDYSCNNYKVSGLMSII